MWKFYSRNEYIKKMKQTVFFNRLILLLFIITYSAAQPVCTGAKEILFYDFDNSILQLMPQNFTENLSNQLKDPLLDIGYCLIHINTILSPEIKNENSMIMLFSVKKLTDPTNVLKMEVDLIKTNEAGEVLQSKSSSFISLTFSPQETNTVGIVLIRKIIENLRTQYICHLRIQSAPQGLTLRTKSGLEGVTPLEWIVPVGVLRVVGEKKGYQQIDKTIDLTEPGVHTLHLQLQKKPFYQSKMIIPGSALLLASAVCFISERYYYKNYHDLKKIGVDQNPGLSEKTYKKAKTFERLGIASLALSCISFALSFKF